MPSRDEVIELLKRIKEDYVPEIYAKETYNRRMAVQYAIDALEVKPIPNVGLRVPDVTPEPKCDGIHCRGDMKHSEAEPKCSPLREIILKHLYCTCHTDDRIDACVSEIKERYMIA